MRYSLALLITIGIFAASGRGYGQAPMKNNQWQMAMNVIPKSSPDYDPDETAPTAKSEAESREPHVRVVQFTGAGATTSKDGQSITFTYSAQLLNTSYRQIGEVDLILAVLDRNTKKVLFQSKPVAFTSFDNLNIPHIGALEPYGLEGTESVGKFTVPADLWTTGTYMEVRVSNVAPVKDERDLHDIGNLISLVQTRHNFEIEQLIAKDPSILEVSDSQGTTPVLVVAAIGTPRLERFLLAHGGNFNDKNKDNQVAMDYAAARNNVKMLDFALAHGQSANPPYSSPIGIAALLNADQSITWLIAHGAKIDRRNSEGDTPAMLSIAYGNLQAFNALLAGKADIHAHNLKGFGLMHFAVSRYAFLPKLLEAGLSVDDPNTTNGETPLMVAEYQQNHWVAKWLLDHGAKLMAKDKNGNDVFFYARKSNTLGSERFFRDYFNNDFSKYGG